MVKALDVETTHGTFAIEDAGSPGIPLVCLHGAVANLRAWDGVIPALGPGLRPITIDLPAHGWTLIDTLGFPELAGALVEICDHLQLRDPIVVGHSFGGVAAVVAAGTGRFSGAIAIDPYLSNQDVRRSHDSLEQALDEAHGQPWPWDEVSDIEADIDRAVTTLYSPGRVEQVLRAIQRRGYREQAGGMHRRYPRREDNMAMIAANWGIDLQAVYGAVACPLAIALATDAGPDGQLEGWAAQRREALERLERSASQIDSREFSCGHDIVGLEPSELAAYITEWVRHVRS